LEDSSGNRLSQPLSSIFKFRYGCFKDKEFKITNAEPTLENIWSIGGDHSGWYYEVDLE
jgi:hypothetical protein